LPGANILVDNDGNVMIADFGLARILNDARQFGRENLTDNVVTLWYRAPELLLGERKYTQAVDMWALGYIALVAQG
jgi:serine/threonine protein kinase